MRTKTIYYCILFVYILLWTCQLVACHMTHSLIILTDSYINLFKILDISLGLLHLCTQQELNNIKLSATKELKEKGSTAPALAGRLFDSDCTYQFKRLPLLGSFINGLFLAALLMSAAIEGIQTCVHSSHSQDPHDKSILRKDPLTYPIILAGFALVGLIMQHCSVKAHEMREEELESESLLDITQAASGLTMSGASGAQGTDKLARVLELSATDLKDTNQVRRSKSSSLTSSSSSSISKRRSCYEINGLKSLRSHPSKPTTNGNDHKSSLQELPMALAESEVAHSHESKISLKSLKFAINLESISQQPFDGNQPLAAISASRDIETACPLKKSQLLKHSKRDNWFVVRYLASPVALLIYAAIDYCAGENLLVEVFDATLSISVVCLLFAASYPPMKKAGRVLLQTAPDGVNLVKLENDLKASSEHIIKVDNLHVWSLTPRSNRVATCELIIDKTQISTQTQIEQIICEAKFRFLDQNIKCTTIEPVLCSRDELDNGKQSIGGS